MSKSMHVLVVTALVCTGVFGCQPSGRSASNDTARDQAKTPVASVTQPESTAAPAIAVAPPGTPKAPQPIKGAVLPKDKVGAPPQIDAAKAEAARADSVKQAQERADAVRNARLDSLKKAEAAKPVVRTDTTIVRTEPAAPAGTDLAAQGKTPYEENCRKCHGVRGVPPKTMRAKFPKIATFDATFFEKHSSDSVVTILTKGKNEDMKSFKDKLSHSEMVAVAAYIRSFVQK
jgi:mono/diheme cytochrome c family protein